MIELEVQPTCRRGTQGLRQQPRPLRALHTYLAPWRSYAAPARRWARPAHEAFSQGARDTPVTAGGLEGWQSGSEATSGCSSTQLRVIDTAYFMRVRGVPAEKHTPLMVDVDAVNAPKIATSRVKAIPWRRPHSVEPVGGVAHVPLYQRCLHDRRGKPPDPVPATTMDAICRGTLSTGNDHACIVGHARTPCHRDGSG